MLNKTTPLTLLLTVASAIALPGCTRVSEAFDGKQLVVTWALQGVAWLVLGALVLIALGVWICCQVHWFEGIGDGKVRVGMTAGGLGVTVILLPIMFLSVSLPSMLGEKVVLDDRHFQFDNKYNAAKTVIVPFAELESLEKVSRERYEDSYDSFLIFHMKGARKKIEIAEPNLVMESSCEKKLFDTVRALKLPVKERTQLLDQNSSY
jgi:hypothetical protein